MAPFAGPWEQEDTLAIGIDVGTTCSAVSFAHLMSGVAPYVTRVSQWPGQGIESQSLKIPSRLYYDSDLVVKAVGAEAASPDMEAEAIDNEWHSVQYFKLLLHPDTLRNQHKLKAPPALPKGLSIQQVYTDFLKYLFKYSKKFFQEREVNATLWDRLIESAVIVLAHPNGWGIREQHILREAAVDAGLVPRYDAHSRLKFVSEGEASVHYCVSVGELSTSLKPGVKFLVCDAGGSTVDNTSYVVKSQFPKLELEEAKPSGCVQAGGIFVNAEVERHLTKLFDDNNVSDTKKHDWTSTAMDDFEKNAKGSYPNAAGIYSLMVSSSKTCRELSLGIRLGRMSIPPEKMKSFFEPCMTMIKNDIRDQLVDFAVERMLVVGGFGESSHLRQELQDAFETSRCRITLLNDSTAKAVSDGAVIWHCSNFVTARRSRLSYGIEVHREYDVLNSEHRGRRILTRPDGARIVDGAWSTLIEKGKLVREDDSPVITSYVQYHKSLVAAKTDLRRYMCTIYSFGGDPKLISMLRDKNDQLNSGFKSMCTINGDLSAVAEAASEMLGPNGAFRKASFQVNVSFAKTELGANFRWMDKGKLKYGPVSLIPKSLESETTLLGDSDSDSPRYAMAAEVHK